MNLIKEKKTWHDKLEIKHVYLEETSISAQYFVHPIFNLPNYLAGIHYRGSVISAHCCTYRLREIKNKDDGMAFNGKMYILDGIQWHNVHTPFHEIC